MGEDGKEVWQRTARRKEEAAKKKKEEKKRSEVPSLLAGAWGIITRSGSVPYNRLTRS